MPIARIVFFAATLGGILVTVRAAVVGPPQTPVAIAIAVGYLAILLAGVLTIRLRMFADAVVRGPEGARGVALTFDDGPDPKTTREVLDALDAHSAKATFFVIGKKAEAHADVVREIAARGHSIGIHGYAHDRLFSMRGPRRVQADLARAVEAVEKITGTRPSLFRPPIGHTNPTIARMADRLDLTIIGWSVAARDGVGWTSPEEVFARVTRGLEDGAIVALHDAAEHGGRTPAGVVALPKILQRIADDNLVVTQLGGWLEDGAASASSTTKRAPFV